MEPRSRRGPRARLARGSRLGGAASRRRCVDAGGGLVEEGSQLAALPGGQARAEVPADRLPVDRPGAPQRVLAAGGQHGEAGPAVGLVGLSFGQAGGGQLVHDPADPGPAEHGPLAQLAHPQPAARCGVEFEQHVIPGQRHLAGRPQVGFDGRHQPAVGDQQGAPRRDHRLFLHAASVPFACVREHIYNVRAHAHLFPGGSMTQTEPARAATRLAGGAELPAAGRWQIDPGHTELAFVGRHFMLTKVRGRFTGVSGAIQVAEDPGQTSAEVTIDMASVDSGSQARDDHLRSADHFDTARYPTATFSGRAASWQGTSGLLEGELTIRGIARPVTLQVEYLGHAADPWGGHRAVFTAAGTINREDWGLTWNMPLDSGRLLVSAQIRIEIELEAVLQTAS